MKRFYLIIAILMLTLLFSACQTQSTVQTTAAPTVPPTSSPAPTTPSEPSTDTTDEEAIPTNENMYSVALPISTESFSSEDNKLLLTYSYQTMYLDIPDRDVKDKIIMNFAERIEKTMLDSQLILADADAAYKNNPAFTPFSYEIQYDVTHIDQGVLSMFGYIIQIDDTSAMNRHLIAANYNMVTGDMMTLGSILYHVDKKADLIDLVIEHLENRDDIVLYDEFRETVEARFHRDESIDEDFYFSENGLCFYFAPYEIAPRSAGTVIVEIPYNKLTGIIADEYFPAERIYTKGNLNVSAFDTADQENYQSFIELIADPEADLPRILLTTGSAVQDIRISKLVWAQDGLSYTQTKNIYASNFLHRDNAIMIKADFNDLRPNYMVSYSIDGSTYVFYMVMDPVTKQVSLKTSY